MVGDVCGIAQLQITLVQTLPMLVTGTASLTMPAARADISQPQEQCSYQQLLKMLNSSKRYLSAEKLAALPVDKPGGKITHGSHISISPSAGAGL